MYKLALYPICVPEVVQPHYTMREAFVKNFDCSFFDWIGRNREIRNMNRVHGEFLEHLEQHRPDFAFMQVQNPDAGSLEFFRECQKRTKVLHWTGDVRNDSRHMNWYEAVGKEITLTMFSNATDVEIFRSKGIAAEYLQIGYDHNIYFPDGRQKNGPEIVFCANYNASFPLAQYRLECARALHQYFGKRFQLYGSGWPQVFKARSVNCKEEAEIYRSAKIGISVSNFNYQRYHSDRLSRIMGSGLMALSHDYSAIDTDYKVGEELATFINLFDLIDEVEHYLVNHNDRATIAANGYRKATTSMTWNARCMELIDILQDLNSKDAVRV